MRIYLTLYQKELITYNYVKKNSFRFFRFYELKILKWIYIALFFFQLNLEYNIENGVWNKYLIYKYDPDSLNVYNKTVIDYFVGQYGIYWHPKKSIYTLFCHKFPSPSQNAFSGPIFNYSRSLFPRFIGSAFPPFLINCSKACVNSYWFFGPIANNDKAVAKRPVLYI